MWVPDISSPLLLVRLGSTNGNVSTGRVRFRVPCDLHGRISIKSAGGILHWWFNLSYGWLHLGLCNQLGKTPGRVCQSTLDYWNALSNIKYYGDPGNPLCQFLVRSCSAEPTFEPLVCDAQIQIIANEPDAEWAARRNPKARVRGLGLLVVVSLKSPSRLARWPAGGNTQSCGLNRWGRTGVQVTETVKKRKLRNARSQRGFTDGGTYDFDRDSCHLIGGIK